MEFATVAIRWSSSFSTCLSSFSPSSAPRALATAASARAARVGTLRHSAPSASSSGLELGWHYRKLAVINFKLKYVEHVYHEINFVFFVNRCRLGVTMIEQETRTHSRPVGEHKPLPTVLCNEETRELITINMVFLL